MNMNKKKTKNLKWKCSLVASVDNRSDTGITRDRINEFEYFIRLIINLEFNYNFVQGEKWSTL